MYSLRNRATGAWNASSIRLGAGPAGPAPFLTNTLKLAPGHGGATAARVMTAP
ncbi:hypothetical protein AZA_69492 [Nitrospirillum viridazoti Y2]|nr:hypothetical protein AZA_69492 [Nitrospirillum amazonense Y2]